MYQSVIGALLVVLLFAANLVQHEQKKTLKSENTSLTLKVTELTETNRSLTSTNSDLTLQLNDALALNKQLHDANREAVSQATTALEQERKKYAALQVQLNAAMQDAECADLLRTPLCGGLAE